MTDEFGSPEMSAASQRRMRQRRMLSALMRTEEAERKALAKTIHDQVLQDLGVCVLKAELCERWAGMEQAGQAYKEASELRSSLDRVIDQLRGVLAALRPLSREEERSHNLLAAYCQSVRHQSQPAIIVESPVPVLSDRVLQHLLVRILHDAAQAVAAEPAIEEMGVAFRESSDLLVMVVEYRPRPDETSASFLASVDLAWFTSDTVRVDFAGGLTQQERLPDRIRLLFALPTVETIDSAES